ncbi:MAG: exported protein of unknown function [candidate division NC10 bacterium]|nr:exported protein of unknown function [candidate division NC10 bacterium]
MMLREETRVTIGILLLKGWIRWVVLAVLLPALSWAEPSTSSSLAGAGASSDVRVGLTKDTEVIAARALALAEDPRPGGTGGGSSLRPEEGFQSGTWHLGLMGGYSIPHKIFAPRSANVHYAPLLFQIGYTLTDVRGPFPVRGSLEVIFEPTFMITTSPSTTFGEGASFLLRYNFVTGTRWVPFLDLGMGILHWNLRLPTILETRFNFTLQTGPGLHYFVTDHLAITGQVRLHHISNADTEKPNIGVNSSVYLLGVSYFF